MEALILGTVAFDSIKTPFGSAEDILGGSGIYAALAARYFCRPLLSGPVGEDFLPKHFAFLRERNIETGDLAELPGRSFHWSGEYGYDLNQRTTLATELGVLEKFLPNLSNEARAAKFAFLGAFDPRQQGQAMDQIDASAVVAIDTMNYWIEHDRQDLLAILSRVPILIINEGEARELSGSNSIVKAAQKLVLTLASRPDLPATVVIKRGEYGVMVFREGAWFYLPGLPIEEVVDPTGAGDSFAGAFMGYLAAAGSASWESIKQAAVYGSVLASFCVSQMGTAGIEDVPRAAIAERAAWLKSLTEFERQEFDVL